MTQYIKAPFNFVPLNEKVFFPDWADQISHDIPFEDGESGTIELELTAMTPIFVRNGHSRENAEEKDQEYTSFSKDADGNFFIPATSVKGMIRNVLEIISFSKMPVDKRKRYAVRDWENKKLYPLKDINVQGTIRCGWMVKQPDDTYKIMDCDKPYRINHKRIDEYLKSQSISPCFEKNFCETSRLDLNDSKAKIDPKSARFKYELLNGNVGLLENVTFETDAESSNNFQPRRVEITSSGSMKGTLVFTGQPDKWKKDRKRGGKFYEFIFPNSTGNSYNLTEKEVEQFKFIYQDSEDWKYWKRKFENGQGIPVFFRSNGKVVTDFGFSLLYKLAYKNSVEDVVTNFQVGKGIDLAECIFGFTSKVKTLKGRVQFGNAFAVGKAKEMPLTATTLGSPKASYYPLYIAQEGKNGMVANYQTYNDGVISGWKRYPVKELATPKSMNIPNMDTTFRPLDSGTQYKTIIRFHNLKKVELGALLSALTFHGNEDKLFHNIGLAKPQGYGKLKISCTLSSDLMGKEKEFMGEFERGMNDIIGNGTPSVWINSDQIKELLTMAYDKHGVQDELLQYMKLEMQGSNEFITAKSQKEYLKKFSEISTNKFNAASVFEEVKMILQAEDNQRKAELARKEQEERDAKQKQKLVEEAVLKEKIEVERKAKIKMQAEDGPQFLIGEIDFKRGSGKIDTYLKRVGQLSPEFLPLIEEFLISCYSDPKNRDKKKWEEPFNGNHIWKKVSTWVTNDIAQEWYNKIIK